ncbi:MAG: DUF1801 domain-containing protein [Thermoplasmata archaeon]
MTSKKSRTPAEPPHEKMAEIERAADRFIRSIAPDTRIEVKWGAPWYTGKDLICVVGAFTHHVGVEFWRGSTIPDPDHLLEGTGKNLRHVKLRSITEATSLQFARLLRAALQLDKAAEKRTR